MKLNLVLFFKIQYSTKHCYQIDGLQHRWYITRQTHTFLVQALLLIENNELAVLVGLLQDVLTLLNVAVVVLQSKEGGHQGHVGLNGGRQEQITKRITSSPNINRSNLLQFSLCFTQRLQAGDITDQFLLSASVCLNNLMQSLGTPKHAISEKIFQALLDAIPPASSQPSLGLPLVRQCLLYEHLVAFFLQALTT